MSLYAIGDIQGCFRTFESLLAKIGFDPGQDRLWLVGDLVNRGPRSVEVLEWCVDHRDCVTAVLGNHDLHLLSLASGVRRPKATDTVQSVLECARRDELLAWVRKLPLCHAEGSRLLVHAGLRPSWTVDVALRRAREAEALIREHPEAVLATFQRGAHSALSSLTGKKTAARVLETISVLTRIRVVDRRGEPNYGFAGPPKDAPKGLVPWFAAADRASRNVEIVFGHWANLGLHLDQGLCALDTGCVWGRKLTALRLEDRAVFQVDPAD